MIGELFFEDQGQLVAAFVLDLQGNLVRRTLTGPRDALIPYAVEVVTPADEASSPRPWSITPEAVISRVNQVAQLLPNVLKAYPDRVVQKMSFPFAAPVDTSETVESILQAIDVLPGLDEETARTVRETLAIHGVHPLPVFGTFNEAIHQAQAGELCVGEVRKVADGWFSNMKVYRKALVRSA